MNNIFCQHTWTRTQICIYGIFTAAVCKSKILRPIKKGLVRDYVQNTMWPFLKKADLHLLTWNSQRKKKR